MRMNGRYFGLCLFCLAGLATRASAGVLYTGSPNSAQKSIFFDLTPSVPMLNVTAIRTFFNEAAGTAEVLELWQCNVGSYVGNDTTMANWTMVQGFSLPSAGAGIMVTLTLTTPIALTGGQTTGFCLFANTTGGNVRYRTTNPPTTYRNQHLTLFSDTARSALFGGTLFTPRAFVGEILYDGPNELSGLGYASPRTVPQDCATLLTVTVSPKTTPPSTGIAVTADLTAIGGSSTQALFDDGTNGDLAAGDNVFSFFAPVPNSVPTGAASIPYTVTDAQANTYSSNIPITLDVTPAASPIQQPIFVAPTLYENFAEPSGLNTLFRDLNQPRTYQMAFNPTELASIPRGAKITALSWRLFTSVADNPPGTWPTTDLVWANYDVTLSEFPAGVTIDNMSQTNFSANIDAGSAVQVRSGPFTLPANAFTGGAAAPMTNPFADVILNFTTPYVYNGGEIVVTISHTGSNMAGTRFLSAVANGLSGTGGVFKALAANAYNAATGAASSVFVTRFKYSVGLSGIGGATPSAVDQGCDTLITVAVTPGTSPASTGISVTADLSTFGGSSTQTLFDNGTNGDVTANDNIFSYNLTIPGFQAPGTTSVFAMVEDDQCRAANVPIPITVLGVLAATPAATPNNPAPGCQTLLTVVVNPGDCPPSTNVQVIGDLNQIGGSSTQQFFDNATNGDVTANDNTYSFLVTIPGTQLAGNVNVGFSISDNEGHSNFPGLNFTISSPFAAATSSATPLPAHVGDNVVMRVNLNLPSCAVSTGHVVTGDFSFIGGPTNQPFLDNGVAPDAVANDKIFTTSVTIPAPDCANYTFPVAISDTEGHTGTVNVGVAVVPLAGPVLFDNGPLMTHPNGGANGFHLSALQNVISLPNIPAAMNILGFGIAGPPSTAPARAADDFVICDPAGWNVSTITIYAYQTGASTSPSSLTSATLRIFDGPPGDPGSNVVFGDTTTNVMTTSCWTGIYRATLTDPLGSTRPIMQAELTVNQNLPPGRYWVDAQVSGSLASGPFVPPVTRLGQPNTGNSMGSGDGITYAANLDTGNPAGSAPPGQYRAGLPFKVHGAALPYLRGDMNCSGTRDGLDIMPFTQVVVGTDTDEVHTFIADVNEDGIVDFNDVPAMVSLLLN